MNQHLNPLTATGALRAWWAVGMVLVAAVLVAGFSIVYTAQQQRLADRRWCALLVTLDAPVGPQPSTPRGQVIQDRIHQLSVELGCARR